MSFFLLERGAESTEQEKISGGEKQLSVAVLAGQRAALVEHRAGKGWVPQRWFEGCMETL